MSIDMSANFFKLITQFRRHDLMCANRSERQIRREAEEVNHCKEMKHLEKDAFTQQHSKLFKVAKEQEDHLAVTAHYYSVMSGVIQQYFGGNFHFAAPRKSGQKLDEVLREMHELLGEKMQLRQGIKCVDIGCGIGSVMADLAKTGADLTGVTIAQNEVEMGNSFFCRSGLSSQCRLIQGDAHQLPLSDQSVDAVYAVYSLKYFPRLHPIFKEVHRVLRPGGKFLIYDLIKTEKFDKNVALHRELFEGLEYACGMPSLHSGEEMIRVAHQNELSLIHEEDLSATFGRPFHYCFSHSDFFMWLVSSPFVNSIIKLAQTLRILPRGFHAFNRIFLSGTVEKIVKGGQEGILSGSTIFLFEKSV